MGLPPLNALRAFEVVARSNGIKRAADELHVTPGAVSRQIKHLEEYLGFELFDRSSREFALSDEGRRYLAVLTDAFGRIGNATHSLLLAKEKKTLNVSVTLTLALMWLMPRLPEFYSKHPGENFRITTSLLTASTLIPLKESLSQDVDFAIYPSNGDPDGLVAEYLFPIELVPVCSPQLLKQGQRLSRAEDIRHFTLLHAAARPNDWAHWIAAQNEADITPAGSLLFDSSCLAHRAAVAGVGIYMAQRVLVGDDLKEGRVVAPFGTRPATCRRPIVDSGEAYYAVYRPFNSSQKRLTIFRDWLLLHAKACRDEISI
jgi:LysR family glycine cleavage system transcriptional activator